ncbi:MAG: hypothetical protein QM635_10195 [Microbacteriaceae bacterium]
MRSWWGVLAVWLLAALGAAIVLLARPADGPLTWFPVVLALSTIAAFGIQLGVQRREGYLTRVAASVTGAVVVLGGASALALGIG